MRKSSSYSDPLISRWKQIILLILIIKRFINRMLPKGTPISCGLGSENVLVTQR